MTLIDTAEVYGPYLNEELVGRALTGRCDEVVLGDEVRPAQPSRRDGHAAHRPGRRREGPPPGQYGELIDEGKILHYGLSEAAPETIRRAHAVRPVTALQTEYSLWTRDPESEILPLVRELGIGFVAYSPLGRGFLTGRIRSADELDETDFRRDSPRFAGDNFRTNWRIVEVVEQVAAEIGATPAHRAGLAARAGRRHRADPRNTPERTGR